MTAVQSSFQWSSDDVPALIIGSIVKMLPSRMKPGILFLP